MEAIEWKRLDNENFNLKINGVDLGTWHLSKMRHFIQAERISVVSRKVAGKFVKSAMTKGTADISATIKGLSVKIEVKIGKDRQSPEQKKYEQDIINAGGYYFIAKDFNLFYEWYNNNF